MTLSESFIALITKHVPELTNKIQPGAVASTIRPPYGAYQEPTEEPVRTKNGVAYYRTTLEFAVFETTKIAAEQLKNKLRTELDGKLVNDSRRTYFSTAEYEHFISGDTKLHCYVMTFNIK